MAGDRGSQKAEVNRKPSQQKTEVFRKPRLTTSATDEWVDK